MIDEHTVAVDFYDPSLMPQGVGIEYTTEWFEDYEIEDLTFNYGTYDYRNKQVILSDEVYAGVNYTETIYVYGGGNVYLETMPAIEVTYELDPILEQPEQNQVLYTDYGYKITNVNPTSHSFGNRGYSLMNSSVNNIYTSSEPQYNTYDNVGFSNDTN